MGDFDPHQCFKQPFVVSEALEWEMHPTPLMTEILKDEVNLIDVVDLVVDNEMVSVLKVRWPTHSPSARDNAIADNQHELKLLATGHLQGNEEWMAYYKHGKNTIVTKHRDGKYWRFDRDNFVSKSVISKRAAIVAVLIQLGALPGKED